MLQVTNRFHAPIMRQNTVSNKAQNQVQNINFAGYERGNKVSTAYVSVFLGLIATFGLIMNNRIQTTQLLKDIEPRVSSSDYAGISVNADLLVKNRRSFPLTNTAANKYLGGVIDSLEGKGGEPFKENNIAPLVKKARLEELASRVTLIAKHQADRLKAAAAKIK